MSQSWSTQALWQKARGLRASDAEQSLFNRAMVGRELRMIELKRKLTSCAAAWANRRAAGKKSFNGQRGEIINR